MFLKMMCLLVVADHHNIAWTVQWDVAAPDSYPRAVIVIKNTSSVPITYDSVESIPTFGGPTLYVKQHDTMEIHVTNKLMDRVISIHWHGIHQLLQANMDGVPGITQAGILPQHTFVYRFNITQSPGTFFYHSHSGLQSSDGFHGVLVIRDSKTNLSMREYVIALQDWNHELSTTLFTKYVARNRDEFMPDYPYPAVAVLINGKGQFDCQTNLVSEHECDLVRKWGWPFLLSNFNESMKFPSKTESWETNGQCNPSRPPFFGSCRAEQPFHKFICEFNETLRLRLVGVGFSLGLRFWVDGHNLTVVAKDGSDIVPIVDQAAVFLHAGERLDVLLTCDQPSQSYFVFVAIAYEFYGKMAHLKSPNVSSYAVLFYNDSNDSHFPDVVQYPPDVWPRKNVEPIYFYKSLQRTIPATQRFWIWSQSKGHWWNYETNTSGKRLEWWELNSHVPSSLSGENDILRVCADSANWSSLFTVEPLIFHLTWNQSYEFVLVNNESQPHPWHIHGYTADVLSIGHIGHLDSIISINDTNVPIMRADTFVIPSHSFVQFRILANNPGPWVVHCHMPYHAEVGMLFMLSVEYNGKKCAYQPIRDLTYWKDATTATITAIILAAFVLILVVTFLLVGCIVRKRQRKQTLNAAFLPDVPLV